MKRNTFRSLGHIERMKSTDVKKVYVSEMEGPNKIVRALGRWKDKVHEYTNEGGANG